jgi:hypothetical protein
MFLQGENLQDAPQIISFHKVWDILDILTPENCMKFFEKGIITMSGFPIRETLPKNQETF